MSLRRLKVSIRISCALYSSPTNRPRRNSCLISDWDFHWWVICGWDRESIELHPTFQADSGWMWGREERKIKTIILIHVGETCWITLVKEHAFNSGLAAWEFGSVGLIRANGIQNQSWRDNFHVVDSSFRLQRVLYLLLSNLDMQLPESGGLLGEWNSSGHDFGWSSFTGRKERCFDRSPKTRVADGTLVSNRCFSPESWCGVYPGRYHGRRTGCFPRGMPSLRVLKIRTIHLKRIH